MESIIIDKFESKHYDKNNFIFVIYYNTTDFPDVYVARLWKIDTKTAIAMPLSYCTVNSTLEESRRSLPYGLWCINRNVNDDPAIIETWL